MTVPGFVPEGGTVVTVVGPVSGAVPVYGRVVVTIPGVGVGISARAGSNLTGVSTITVPGLVPEGGTVVTVVGPVIGAVPVYRIVVVMYDCGVSTITVPGFVPAGGTVVTVVGPVIGSVPVYGTVVVT